MKRQLIMITTGPDHLAQLSDGARWIHEQLENETYKISVRHSSVGIELKVTWMAAEPPVPIEPPSWYSEIEANG